MITLNLDTSLKQLDGKDIPDANMAKTLANMLVTGQGGNVLKMFDWGMGLWNDGKITVDQADFDYLKQYVQDYTHPQFQVTTLVKAQLIRALDANRQNSIEANRRAAPLEG